jgi:hypothetical protein
MDGKVCKKTSSSNQCSNGIIFMLLWCILKTIFTWYITVSIFINFLCGKAIHSKTFSIDFRTVIALYELQ